MNTTPVHVLIDGNNLVHRVYHALAHADRATKAKLIATQVHALARLGSRVAIAWDGPGAGHWRVNLYPAYKGQRGEKPPELVDLLESARYWSGLQPGIESVAADGAEADDVIATLWHTAYTRGERVLLVSADRDLFQLLRAGSTTQLTAYRTDRGELAAPTWWTSATFEAKYGFLPPLWPTYRAMVGDKSDNLPGVLGLGPAAAGQVCRRWLSIDDAMADLWAIPLNARQRTALANAWNDGSLKRFIEICTLRRDVVQPCPGTETRNHGPAVA